MAQILSKKPLMRQAMSQELVIMMAGSPGKDSLTDDGPADGKDDACEANVQQDEGPLPGNGGGNDRERAGAKGKRGKV